MEKNFLKLTLSSDKLSSLNIKQLIKILREIKGEPFCCNNQESDELTAKTKADPVCDRWNYLIFYSDLDKLYFAKVFIRIDNNGMELFNINSSDSKYSKLTKSQYNTIVLAFKKFIGAALSQIVDIAEIK